MTLAMPKQRDFWAYRERLRALMLAELGAGEAAEGQAHYRADGGAPAPLDERLLQTIWAQQLLSADALRLADGRAVRVLDPGRWNGSAGPDFAQARLMIGDQPVTGDVELHLDPADWINHGHHRDLDYNGVVLHAVLSNDGGRSDDPLHNGGATPRLELEPYIFPDLETLRRSLTPDDYHYEQPRDLGRCHRLMTELESGTIADFLDRAGDARLEAKTARLDQHGADDPEQVFYQGLMMSLGAGPARTLYYLLAKRTPLRELLAETEETPPEQRVTALEALLLHVAGLVPAEDELVDAPAEARERASELARWWERQEPYWADRAIPPTRRWYGGIRPVNFPVRRLAGVARLIARRTDPRALPLEELVGAIRRGAPSLEGAPPLRRKRHPLLMELVGRLTVAGDGSFWGTHYSFTAKPAARTMNLIGEGAATSLVVNALLPAALLQARRERDRELGEAIKRLFAIVPPLQANHITEFMTTRLFGADPRAGALIVTERRRQALHQIFHHCCNGESGSCEACYYLTGQAPAR